MRLSSWTSPRRDRREQLQVTRYIPSLKELLFTFSWQQNYAFLT
jgi:hypothetical protein